jgi:diguanylate cyclase (GGDEF)-like protein
MEGWPVNRDVNGLRRDVVFGGALINLFAVVVIITAAPLGLGSDGTMAAGLALSAGTAVVGLALVLLLWRTEQAGLLVLFPLALLAALIGLVAVGPGWATNYTGFITLAILYVGLTQRRRVVVELVAIAFPCWLLCQTEITAPIVVRATIVVGIWLLTGLALASRTARDRARTVELVDRANTDDLTGLVGRHYLSQLIDQALGTSSGLDSTLLVIDLDDFKSVNDTLGHGAGDELLISIASRILAAFRSVDVCARLGGDEFAVLIRDTDLSQADDAAVRLLERIAQPVILPGGRVAVTASIGVAGLDGARNGQEVLHHADLAMYDAKANGRNQSSIFHRELSDRRTARLQLEADLRSGLTRSEFELYYQPIVHLQTGAVVGTEALLRWNHPVRGLLAPDQFLSVSQDIGVIVALGDWILDQACEQAVRWQPADPGHAVSMAVNVSAPEMLSTNFVPRVRAALARSGLPGRLLVLEITERLLVTDAPLVRARIHELRQLGVRIAIDDFGTGYSSLAYLRELPADILKIDQSFVKPLGIDSQAVALLKSIIAIANAVHLAIVVEGVETRTQANILSALGCEVAQGHLFAVAQPANDVQTILTLNSRDPIS